MENDKIYAAIQSLTDNPFTIIGDDFDNIIWHSEEKSKPTKSQIMKEVERLDRTQKTEAENRKNARLSAIAKLQDLGLTEEEAKAFLG